MSRRQTIVKGVPSKAAIKDHPIHPMLIPFPITLLVAAFVTDLAYVASEDEFWARASTWLTGSGFVMGVIAAAFGLTDFVSLRKVREHKAGWIHFIGNAAVLALAFASWVLRLGDPSDAVVPLGIMLSVSWTAILAITGWYGGELSYRHGVGVTGE